MGGKPLGAALAALPLLALALTGCGSGGGGDQVASANGGKSTASATASLSPDEQAAKFASCMRKYGVEVQEGTTSEGGAGTTRIDPAGVDKATLDKANEACRKYQPQMNAGGKMDPGALEATRKMSACMRKNGVEDFPDPASDGSIMITKAIADDPDFQAAQKKCQSLMPGPQGTKATT
jgi:hypothetical protein